MPEKKPYRSPELVVYGDVRKLTQSTSNPTVNTDGPSGMKT